MCLVLCRQSHAAYGSPGGIPREEYKIKEYEVLHFLLKECLIFIYLPFKKCFYSIIIQCPTAGLINVHHEKIADTY